MAESSTGINRLALDRLKTLPAELKREFGLSATQEEIASAVIYETTVPQIAGMLLAYVRYKASLADEDPDESDG